MRRIISNFRWNLFVNGLLLVALLIVGGFAQTAVATATPSRPDRTFTLTPVPPTHFRVATYNALGYSHTDLPRGNETWRLPAKQRTDLAFRIFQHRHFSVVGLQEFQSPQRREFRRIAGTTFGLYCPATAHSPYSGQNCVAWRRADWTVAAHGYMVIPYFYGRRVHMPVLTLKNRASGELVTFTSVHNPTSSPKDGNQYRHRLAGWKREAARAERVAQWRGVVLLGDRNQHADVYTRHLPRGFHVAGRKGIDFITGSSRAHFRNYTSSRSGYVSKATDHPVVYADVTVN